MKRTNTIILNAGDASGSLTSSAFWLDQIYVLAIQAKITGSTAGTIKLQGSADLGSTNATNPAAGAGIVTWTDIADSSTSVNGTGSVTWNYQGVGYEWIRVVYTRVSGTGSITCTVNAKGG